MYLFVNNFLKLDAEKEKEKGKGKQIENEDDFVIVNRIDSRPSLMFDFVRLSFIKVSVKIISTKTIDAIFEPTGDHNNFPFITFINVMPIDQLQFQFGKLQVGPISDKAVIDYLQKSYLKKLFEQLPESLLREFKIRQSIPWLLQIIQDSIGTLTTL
jgi:hypothetical protein